MLRPLDYLLSDAFKLSGFSDLLNIRIPSIMKVIAEHVAQAKLDVGVFITMLNTKKSKKKMCLFYCYLASNG
jgi:hypothetical protein